MRENYSRAAEAVMGALTNAGMHVQKLVVTPTDGEIDFTVKVTVFVQIGPNGERIPWETGA